MIRRDSNTAGWTALWLLIFAVLTVGSATAACAGDFVIAPTDLRAQADVLRPPASAPLSGRVAYAASLDQMELKDEACKYWRSLAAERPDDVRIKALAAE